MPDPNSPTVHHVSEKQVNWIITLGWPLILFGIAWGSTQARITQLESDIASVKAYHHITAEEVHDYVDHHSPYMAAKDAIGQTLQMLGQIQQRQQVQLDDLRRDEENVRTAQARMDAKLDMIVGTLAVKASQMKPDGDNKN